MNFSVTSIQKQKEVIGFLLGISATLLAPKFANGFVALSKKVRNAIARQQQRSLKQHANESLRVKLTTAAAWTSSTDAVSGPAVSTDELERITQLSVAELRQCLISKQLTSVRLLKIFVASALQAHKKTNCIVDLMLEQAIEAATLADDEYAAADPIQLEKRRLLGLPISVKENLGVANTAATIGLTHRANFSTADCSSVQLLRRAGAVVFAKTNVPALLLSYECHNELFGRTTNPVSVKFTPGGSSGGEGALVALRGSVAGIGTDIGGSIRIPCMFCGVVGIKPTSLRISNRGNQPERGADAVPSITGPMGRSVADVTALFRALTPQPYPLADGVCSPKPFDEQMFQQVLTSKKPLRIGFYCDDGFIATSPPCRRAVLEAVERLRRQGHNVVPWSPPKVFETVSLFYRFLSADGGRSLRDTLGPDAPSGAVVPILRMSSLPKLVRRLISWYVGLAFDAQFGRIIGLTEECDVYTFNQMLAQRNRIRHEVAEAMSEFDCIVAPGMYVPAVKCGSSLFCSFGCSMTAYYNVLDFPVVALPTAQVDKDLDSGPWNDRNGGTKSLSGMSKSVAELYDPQSMHGLPVGVQIITARYTEEKALAIAKIIESSK